MAPSTYIIAGIIIFYIAFSIRIVREYEQLVVFTLGKFTGIRKAGLRFVWLILQTSERVDLRIRTIDIPRQQVMTVDNVPVIANGVIYFKVSDASEAIIKVEDYEYAITQYAETALRDVIGSMDLDSVLSKRDAIGDKIKDVVGKETKGWGLSVDQIKLQDVEVPDDLKRLMSRQASAEREKRANIIKAEGDSIAAVNLAKAAAVMAKSEGAMQLRTLQTIDGLGPTPSNTIVLAVPVELMEAVRTFTKNQK